MVTRYKIVELTQLDNRSLLGFEVLDLTHSLWTQRFLGVGDKLTLVEVNKMSSLKMTPSSGDYHDRTSANIFA